MAKLTSKSSSSALLWMLTITLPLAIACVPANRDAAFVESTRHKNQYTSDIGNSLRLKMTNQSGLEFYLKPYLLFLWLEVEQLRPEDVVRISPGNMSVTFNNRKMEIGTISIQDTGWSENKYFAHLQFKVQTIGSDFPDSARLEFRFDSVLFVNETMVPFGPVLARDQLYNR